MQKPPQLKPLFIERMKKLLGNEMQDYLEILKQPILRSIRCNTLKISPEELKIRLEKKGWLIKQPWPDYPEVFIVEGKFVFNKFSEDSNDKSSLNNKKISSDKILVNINNPIKSSEASENSRGEGGISKNAKILINLEPGELGRALEHLLGYYYIQELASMLPVLILEPKSKELILDLCASPGSKTTQISAEMKNTGTIIANEISISRIQILASNLERCGCSNTIITKKEGRALGQRLKKEGFHFDKILVDAPCSGEGTLRSSPKTYLMWNIRTIKSLPKIQKELVKNTLEILNPNGTLVYSTCTHAPEENEGVISNILNENKNIKLESINLPIKYREGITEWENNKFNPQVKKCARIYPQDSNTEGFFIAKIKKIK